MDDQQTASQPEDEAPEATDPAEDQAGPINDLVESVRQRALQELLPLLDSLEGAPEYRFEIIMNALQASQDPTLLEKALAAANEITAKSTKAEALIDLLQEVNVAGEG